MHYLSLPNDQNALIVQSMLKRYASIVTVMYA